MYKWCMKRSRACQRTVRIESNETRHRLDANSERLNRSRADFSQEERSKCHCLDFPQHFFAIAARTQKAQSKRGTGIKGEQGRQTYYVSPPTSRLCCANITMNRVLYQVCSSFSSLLTTMHRRLKSVYTYTDNLYAFSFQILSSAGHSLG